MCVNNLFCKMALDVCMSDFAGTGAGNVDKLPSEYKSAFRQGDGIIGEGGIKFLWKIWQCNKF